MDQQETLNTEHTEKLGNHEQRITDLEGQLKELKDYLTKLHDNMDMKLITHEQSLDDL